MSWLRDWNVGQYVYYRLLGYVDAHLPQVVEVLLELHYVLRGLQQILGNVLLNGRHVEHQRLIAQQDIVLLYLARVDCVLNVVRGFYHLVHQLVEVFRYRVMHVRKLLRIQVYAMRQAKDKIVKRVRRDLLLLCFDVVQHRQGQN